MIKMKIYGIFLSSDNESFTTTRICELTNTEKDIVTKIINKLKKEKKIRGTRKFLLKK